MIYELQNVLCRPIFSSDCFFFLRFFGRLDCTTLTSSRLPKLVYTLSQSSNSVAHSSFNYGAKSLQQLLALSKIAEQKKEYREKKAVNIYLKVIIKIHITCSFKVTSGTSDALFLEFNSIYFFLVFLFLVFFLIRSITFKLCKTNLHRHTL